MDTTQSKIQGAAQVAAKDWYRRQCRDCAVSMYLYFKPDTIAFWIGEYPLNEDWQLAWNERISIGKTQEQVTNDIIQIAQKLPILSS